MLNIQELLKMVADAASNPDDAKYKSVQDLLLIIAGCVGVDEETGEAYIRVKADEDDADA